MDAFIKNSSGSWRKIPKIFIKNSSGQWRAVVSAYIKNSSGVWRQFFGASYLYPSPTTNPTLTSDNTLDYIFSAGSTITLTRGVWDKSPTSYSLKIQSSIDNSTWTDVASGTGTSLTYDITYSDALNPSLYFRGKVVATNAYGPGTFYTASTISVIELAVSGSSSSPTTNGATISWSVTPSTASYRASQYIDIYDSYYPTVIVYSHPVTYNASSAVISNTAIISNRLHYAIVRVVSNDSSATINSSNTISFTTTGTLTNTVAPTIIGTKQEGQTLSADPGTWSGATPITYSYEWMYGFEESGSVYSLNSFIPPVTGSNYFVPYDYNENYPDGLGLKVTATNAANPSGVVAYSQIYAIANFARPVGTDNTVLFSRDGQTGYTYSVTSPGTWSGSPTSYRYQWYTREQGAGGSFAYFKITGATSSTFNASSYVTADIFPIVWASNAGGESNTGYPFSSTHPDTLGAIDQGGALTVYYKAPVINSFSVTGSAASATYTYSISADDSNRTLSISYYNSSTGTLAGTFIPGSSGSTQTGITAGTYNFVLTVTNSLAGNSYSTTSTVANVIVQAAISAISLSDTTLSPGSASSISVANSATTNVGSVSWTNGSNTTFANLYSVSGSGSGGAGTNPTTLATSGTFTIDSTGTATATIRAINTTKRASVTWTQGSGIQSYRIVYSISGLGLITLDGNSSATNPTVLLSSDTVSRTITLSSISVYSGLNQTNLVSTASNTSSVSPTNKTTDSSGSGSVTFTSLTWTITWNANGGSGGGTTTVARGSAHTAPSAGTRTGYTFAGWRNPPSGDILYTVSDGGTFTPTSDITFTGRWTNNSSAGSVTLTTTDTAGAGGRFSFSNTTATGVTGTLTYYWTLGTSTNFTLYNSLTANTNGVVNTGRTTPLVFRVYSQFTGQDGGTYTSGTAQASVTFT